MRLTFVLNCDNMIAEPKQTHKQGGKQMRIYKDYDFDDLMDACWGDAIDTLNTIQENDKEEEFMSFLSLDSFVGTPDLTEVNDFLCFEDTLIFEMLGIDMDSNDDDDDEEDEDEDDGDPCPFTGKLCTAFECEECDIKRR